jgi:hypothetical protein
MAGVLIFLLGAGVLACTGDSTQPALVPADLPAMDEDGVRAAVVLEEQAEGVATLVVSVDARALELGAYQGRLEFDAERFALLDAEAPHGSDGFRVVNAAEPGIIRFAGFTTDGFTSPVAVRLRLRGAGELRSSDVALVLDVAGTVDGEAVDRARYQTPQQLFTTPVRRER